MIEYPDSLKKVISINLIRMVSHYLDKIAAKDERGS